MYFEKLVCFWCSDNAMNAFAWELSVLFILFCIARGMGHPHKLPLRIYKGDAC